MRYLLTLFFALFVYGAFANMASPVRPGTHAADVFSSRDIDILREQIHVKIDRDFKTALYSIEYFIRADSSGMQVPLLFYARDFRGDFKVWVDGNPVALSDLPASYATGGNDAFDKFSGAFVPSADAGSGSVAIQWDKRTRGLYRITDLKYFETALTRGEHSIRVAYTANVWTDVSDWVKTYSFRYALAPAANWRSFGTLDITVDATAFKQAVGSNLGAPASGSLDSVAVWHFSKLPADFMEINFQPEISGLANILVAMEPFGLSLIVAFVLVMLHFFAMQNYRRNNAGSKYSRAMILGSLLVPLIALIFYIASFSIIDHVIGDDAGGYHGYTFLAMILYPVALPVYWLVMWLVDRMLKQKMLATSM